MKLSTLVVLILVSLCAYALATSPFQARVTVTHASAPTQALEVGFTVEVPTAAPTNRPRVTKAVAKATHGGPTSKHLVCGPMHDNQVGGRNSNCEWQ
jgi:hypothetical protein